MNILLTNDDGYDAPGILALFEALTKDHNVTLVAPDSEKSAVGHGISLNHPLRLEKVNIDGHHHGFAVNGTPADCVKLALYELFPEPPDLVIAGINPGSNTGININYSGTAAAAREAVFNRIPGMAVSIEIKKEKCFDFIGMARFITSFITEVPDLNLPQGTFLNINGPDAFVDQTRGVKITRQGNDNISTDFEKREDPKGRAYFWYAGVNRPGGIADTDIEALSDNYISISPLRCDTTDPGTFAGLKRIAQAEWNGYRN